MRDCVDLEARIACLDDRSSRSTEGLSPVGDVEHLVSVVQQIVQPNDVVGSGRTQIATDADTADAAQRRCHLLERLGRLAPSVVDGPVDLGAQYWIATGRAHWLPPVDRILHEEKFVAINPEALRTRNVKPFGFGLFTSTGLFDTPGMWRIYLRGYENSQLYPGPWLTWHVRPRQDAAVYEVRDAARWVELLESYPRNVNGLVFPDWPRIAESYDAVHITLRAVVATQGVAFVGRCGLSAPPFWDVETTWWLRWCFSSAEPLPSGL